jgi:hypothetical protein
MIWTLLIAAVILIAVIVAVMLLSFKVIAYLIGTDRVQYIDDNSDDSEILPILGVVSPKKESEEK